LIGWNSAIAGTCGTSNGKSLTQAPTTGLCSSGTLTANPSIRPNARACWSTMCPSGTGCSPADHNWHWYCDDTQCHATDPNAAYKPFFGAAEIESYSGSFPKPATVTTWIEQFCSLMYTLPAYSEYDIESCQSLSMGDHGGCHCCVMSRVVWKKKAAVSGSCGSANGAYYTIAPTSGLCSYGTASAVSGSGPWAWTCSGTNGGATVNCSANKNVTYSGCGSAAEVATHIIPSANLCTDGSRPKVYSGYVSGPSWSADTISGDWYWWCGSTRCHAPDPYKDYKGPFASTMMQSYTGSNPYLPDTASVWLQYFCSWGMPTENQTIYQKYDLVSCSSDSTLGTYGGCDWCVMSKFDIKLKSTAGVCGTSSGVPVLAAPTTGLCSSGNPSAVTGTGPWTWSCSGVNGGANVSCNAPLKGQCGSANTVATYTTPTLLCAKGTASTVSVAGDVYSWKCNGSSSSLTTDDVSCSAPRKLNGVCGSANGTSSANTPSANLCSAGVASEVTPSTNTFAWSCNGVNGGTASSCSATRIPSACGSANGSSFVDAPTTGLCNIGVPVSATLTWFNYDFLKRKAITVTNNAGSIINDSAIVLDVVYDSDMQADFDDLRFYSSTGTSLQYWIESKTNGATARVWVKIPSIPVAGATIYMYYGNSNVVTTSSTVSYNSLFFQDSFDGNNISNWTKSSWGSSSGDIIADNNRIRLRAYQCYNATITKNLGFLSGDLYVSFDWERYVESYWGEMGDWMIMENGVALNPQGGYSLGNTPGGRYTGSVKDYKVTVNGNIDLRFALTQSWACNIGDHSNTYIWIDNVKVTGSLAANTTNTFGSEVSVAANLSASGPWSWKCASGGSVSSLCTANTISPACGSANGGTFETAPTTGLCAYGTASIADIPACTNTHNMSSGTLTISANNSVYCVSGTASGANNIVINPNVTATINFNGNTTIDMSAQGKAAVALGAGSKLTINIASGVTVNVIGGNAALLKNGYAGINVPTSAILVVQGSGTLNATGGNAAASTYPCAGPGGAGAGIGGNGGTGYNCPSSPPDARGANGGNGEGAGTIQVFVKSVIKGGNGSDGGAGGPAGWGCVSGSAGINGAAGTGGASCTTWYACTNGGSGGGYPAAGIGGGGGGGASGQISSCGYGGGGVKCGGGGGGGYGGGGGGAGGNCNGGYSYGAGGYNTNEGIGGKGGYNANTGGDGGAGGAGGAVTVSSNVIAIDGKNANGTGGQASNGTGTSLIKGRTIPGFGSGAGYKGTGNASYVNGAPNGTVSYSVASGSFGPDGPWEWYCVGGGTSSPKCIANQPTATCGTANGQSFATVPTTGLCSYGNPGSTDWMDNSYLRRKVVTVSNSSGVALSNYQVKLTVAYDSDMQTDFDDLRFTSSDKKTLLNYWLESKTDSSSAVVWVKLPSIPTTGTTIYMYYGNSKVSSGSNGDNTFILFDDFNGGSINTAKWTEVDSSGNVVQTGGTLRLNNGPVNWGNTGLYSVTNLPRSSMVIEGKYMNNCTAGAYYRDTTMLWMKDTSTSIDYPKFTNAFYAVWYNSSYYWTVYESGTNIAGTGALACNTQYRIRQIVKPAGGAITQLSSNNGASWTTVRDSANYAGSIKVGVTHYDGGVVFIDDLTVRNYVSAEPTAVFDTEQSNSATPTGTGPWEWYCAMGTRVSPKCVANSSTTAGQCPVTTSSRATPTPTCIKGTASALTSLATTWTWTCTGTGTGTGNVCTAVVNKIIDGVVGSDNNGNFTTLASTSTNLCSKGTVENFSGSGPWVWVCQGLNGGNNANGSANKTNNGACGTVNGTNVSTLTSASPNLCSSGTVTGFTGTGPWTWICSGNYGGTNASCSANMKINGDCGTVAGTSVTALASTSPNLCKSGTVKNFTGTGPWNWMCSGSNDGTSVGCTAYKLETLSVSLMLNPEEFNPEQCVWCEYYREDPEDINSAVYKGMKEATDSGIAVVSPKFRFSFNDLSGKQISQYMFAISTGTNPDTANINSGWMVPEKVSGKEVTIKPNITINRFGTENQTTKQIKYNKTYNWWVKIKNVDGAISSWSPMKQFITVNHEWPKVGALIKQDIGTGNVQVCSTMVNITNPSVYTNDPCYSVCWSDYANKTAPLLDDARWKCSVCYNSSGAPVLCQDLPPAKDKNNNVVSRFTWEVEDATFPTVTNIYAGGTNGKTAFNPIVKFSSSLESTPKKIRFRLRGSDCPLDASATARTIRPIWTEK